MGTMIDLSKPEGARGYLAIPEARSGPGLLVLQEWWGLNPQIKGTADMLAGHGFVALAPDLYRGELAGHDEMDKAGELMTGLPPERAAADMSVAVDALARHTAVNGDGIGVIGFCMGGMLAFMVAALRGDLVKVAVPFYGFPLPDSEPEWDGLSAIVRGHFAAHDDFFPADAARDLQSRLQAMGKDVEIAFHEAGHAWMNETDPFGVYDADLAAELWPVAIELFHEHLG